VTSDEGECAHPNILGFGDPIRGSMSDPFVLGLSSVPGTRVCPDCGLRERGEWRFEVGPDEQSAKKK
jgi:hypothetical protein